MLVLGISTSLAYMMNTAAVGALSAATQRSDAVSRIGEEVSNPCRLDADRALYARVDRWLPAARSAFCRAENYPWVPDRFRDEISGLLARTGPLEATITSVAPTGTRIDLYCPTGKQSSAGANFVSVVEVREAYVRVCTSAASPDWLIGTGNATSDGLRMSGPQPHLVQILLPRLQQSRSLARRPSAGERRASLYRRRRVAQARQDVGG